VLASWTQSMPAGNGKQQEMAKSRQEQSGRDNHGPKAAREHTDRAPRQHPHSPKVAMLQAVVTMIADVVQQLGTRSEGHSNHPHSRLG
jgi:hypothetical protein